MIKIYTKLNNGRILVTKKHTPEELSVELERLSIEAKKQQEMYERAKDISPETWNMRVTI